MFVHRRIGDANPTLDQSPAALLENSPDARLIDADRLQRLIERIVRNRQQLGLSAFSQRAAEVRAFEESDDVQALSPLQKQLLWIGLSPAEFNDAMLQQLANAGGEIE